MRKIVATAGVLLASLFISGSASAQEEGDDGKKFGIGGDLQIVIPTGSFSNGTSLMIGPLFKFGYRVIPNLEITGRTGFLLGVGDLGVNMIPLWGGARYFFMQPGAGAYAGGEMGLNMLLIPGFDLGPFGSTPSQSEARFGMNLGGGYVISRELPIDIRGQLMMLNIGDDNSLALGIGLSGGYTYHF